MFASERKFHSLLYQFLVNSLVFGRSDAYWALHHSDTRQPLA